MNLWRRFLTQRTWPAHLALLAVWVLALAPTASRVWAASAPPDVAALHEICTVDGTRWLEADAGAVGAAAADSGQGYVHLLDHCAWCGLTHHAAFWPALPTGWQTSADLSADVFGRASSDAPGPQRWPHATPPSRAPPGMS